MPSATSNLKIRELRPTFACEITGIDLSTPPSDEEFEEIEAALHKYGVVVIPKANFPNDRAQIDFSARFGVVEKSKYRLPYMRNLPDIEIFDISNLDQNGEVVTTSNEKRITAIRGNALWHADGSFNPQRTYVSLLRAVELPPSGTGGTTEYADARQAYRDLDDATKAKIQDLVVGHSFFHNRKTANPDSPLFRDIDVMKKPISRHRLVNYDQDGKEMLYVTSYSHHIEGMPLEEGQALLKQLMKHATQPKYMFEHEWVSNGDIVIWDNTAVLHRATAGSYEGKYVRDMRRTCVMDASKDAFGLNDPELAKNQANSS